MARGAYTGATESREGRFERAMQLAEDNVSQAARLLGMSRAAQAYRLTKLE